MTIPYSKLWDSSPPDKIALKTGDIHLWRIPLKLAPHAIANLKNLLSVDELTRADRLLDRAKAQDFIVARARLRQILGRYLDLKPAAIQFEYGAKGKPSLKKSLKMELFFNLSHAGDLALLALTPESEVGVDIECIDPQLDYEKLATQFFSPYEKDLLMQFPSERRRRGFYRIWTGKEAWLKCLGHGFSLSDKDRGHEDGPDLNSSNNNFELITFHLTKNYVGSLVMARKISSIKRWHLSA